MHGQLTVYSFADFLILFKREFVINYVAAFVEISLPCAGVVQFHRYIRFDLRMYTPTQEVEHEM